MDMKEIGTIAGNGLTYILAAIQSNEILQWIEFGLSIAVSCILLAYRVWRWYKEAKKDGKITPDELKQLADEVEESKKDFEDIKK